MEIFVDNIPINDRINLIHHNSSLDFSTSLLIYKSLESDTIANIIKYNTGDAVFIGLTTLAVAAGDRDNFIAIYNKTSNRTEVINVLFAFCIGASINRNSVNFLESIHPDPLDVLTSLVSAMVINTNAAVNAKEIYDICLGDKDINQFTSAFYNRINNLFGDSNELKACLEIIFQSGHYRYRFFTQLPRSNALKEWLAITDI